MAQLPSVPFHSFVHRYERNDNVPDTNAVKDLAKLTDHEKLTNVIQDDKTGNFNKEQAKQANHDEALPDSKKSSDTVPERELPVTDSEQFVCTLERSNGLDQDQVVPEASASAVLDSSQNQSPFVYDEDRMDWEVRGDDSSIVLSEVSSDSEHLVLSCSSPVDEAADNGDHHQSHLLYGQHLTEKFTGSLVMPPSSTATNIVEDHNMESPENSSVEALMDETENQDLDRCQCYCLYCRQCYERRINTKLVPCCDAFLCTRCAECLLAAGRPCPKCNQPIRGISPIKLP